MTADEFAALLGGSQRGGSWQCRCPAHNDSRPSLKVTQAVDRVLIHCWAGCPTEAVLRALDLTWKDLFDEEPPSKEDLQWRKIARKAQQEDQMANLEAGWEQEERRK